MKKVLVLFLTAIIFSFFCSCKKEPEFPDREAHMNNNVSTYTYSEYEENAKKEKQEKIDRIKNAEWKKKPEKYKLIALTFDDAPSYSTATNNNTVKIIDAINKYEGAGTLFCIGKNIDSNGTALLEYALELNFELANHTYNHNYLDKLSKSEVKDEILSLNKLINEKLGVTPRFVRPGYGNVNDTVFEVTTELKMPVIWTEIKGISDYSPESTAMFIENKVVNGAKDGAIVLLHGNIDNTASAMENICKRLYEKGYRFVTVSELFEYKGIKNIPTDKMIENAGFN